MIIAPGPAGEEGAQADPVRVELVEQPALPRTTRSAIKANTLGWLAVLLLVGGGLYFLDERDADRQRDICGLIVLLDETYHAAPPTTTTGRQVAAQIHQYRQRIGC